MKCPKCGSASVRESRRGKWNDPVHRAVGQTAYRCRDCRARFYFAEPPESRSSKNSSRRRRRAAHAHRGIQRRFLEVALFVIALVLFLVFLRYITREQVPPSDSGQLSIPSAVLTA